MSTDALVAFLLARLDKDEQAAYVAWPGPWATDGEECGVVDPKDGIEIADVIVCSTGQQRATARHIARHHPARVLAEVDAKRRIIAEHPILTAWRVCTRCSDFAEHTSDLIRKVPGPCQTLRLLALPYASHPDYRPEWAPSH